MSIELNVGGTKYTASKETLTWSSDCFLAKMIKFREETLYFIDRDGILFRYVLNYLRTRKLWLDVEPNLFFLDAILQEADFFALDGLIIELKEMKNKLLEEESRKIRERQRQLVREQLFLKKNNLDHSLTKRKKKIVDDHRTNFISENFESEESFSSTSIDDETFTSPMDF